ncbi:MAG: FtsH protease activity modulator HflK [Gammaproteobacteria bacterium]|nr:FtsH protease activity modulator HflK [Gammaproteobacteria bacterium]
MAWNPQKKPSQGLPDLEAHLKKFFKNLFKPQQPTPAGQPEQPKVPVKAWKVYGAIAVILLGGWGVSGAYQIQSGQQVIVTSFGHIRENSNPGWHWYARFIEQKYSVDTTQALSVNLTESLVSKDQAVLSAEFSMQYQITNAKQYLFNVSDMQGVLQQIIEAKLNQDVGSLTLAQLLGDNSSLEQNLQQQIQQVCDQYNLGVSVKSIAIQNIQVPDQVQGVLNSLQGAQQASQNLQSQAQSQAATELQTAQTNAAQIIAQAQAQVVNAVPKAKQQVAEFLAILPAYQQNPQVTRERLYYDAMEKVYGNAHVIIVDTNSAVNLPAGLLQAGSNPSQTASAPALTNNQSSAAQTSAYARWKEAQASES